jgi:hypothetical protein
MVFKNLRLFFLESDDFSKDAKMLAAQDFNRILEAGWSAFRDNSQNTRFDVGGSSDALDG